MDLHSFHSYVKLPEDTWEWDTWDIFLGDTWGFPRMGEWIWPDGLPILYIANRQI